MDFVDPDAKKSDDILTLNADAWCAGHHGETLRQARAQRVHPHLCRQAQADRPPHEGHPRLVTP